MSHQIGDQYIIFIRDKSRVLITLNFPTFLCRSLKYVISIELFI